MTTRYGYATLTPAMEAELATIVGGQDVFDFACGRGELARWMVRHGAASVTAIDKDCLVQTRSKRIQPVKACIDRVALPDRIAVGVTVWPINRAIAGLVPALHRCDTVVYIGCNDAATMCGPQDLFSYLLTRELLAYHAHPQNSMVVVGKPLLEGQTRSPTQEEAAGLAAWQQIQEAGLVAPRWFGR